MTVGERIRMVRKEAGLTQEEFGKRLSLVASTISMIESGAAKITERTAGGICKEYNISYGWLMTGEGDMYVDNKWDRELLSLEFSELLQTYPALYETAKIVSKHMEESDWSRLNELLSSMGGEL